jgi:hypothetical protein
MSSFQRSSGYMHITPGTVRKRALLLDLYMMLWLFKREMPPKAPTGSGSTCAPFHRAYDIVILRGEADIICALPPYDRSGDWGFHVYPGRTVYFTLMSG